MRTNLALILEIVILLGYQLCAFRAWSIDPQVLALNGPCLPQNIRLIFLCIAFLLTVQTMLSYVHGSTRICMHGPFTP